MLFTRYLIFSLFYTALLFACSSSPQYSEPASKPVKKITVVKPKKIQVKGQKIADLAKSLVGSPYKYGGKTPYGFDCSGLVFYTHGKVGLRTPRTSLHQFKSAKNIPLNELRNGDLIFFKLTRARVSHVGIYVGNGRFIHAPQSGRQVKATYLTDAYWKTKIVSGGRLY